MVLHQELERTREASARDRATAASLSHSLQETRRALEEARQAVREARSQLDDAYAHLAAVQASTSWQVTRPLRLLKDAWTRGLKPVE